MKYIKYKCSQCSYTKEIEEKQMFDVGDCPICGGYLSYDSYYEKSEPTGDNYIDQNIHQQAVDQLRNELDMMGNQRVYEIIEQIADAKVRAKYRQYFIEAGGAIPVTDLQLPF